MTSPIELTLAADGLDDLVLTDPDTGVCYVDLDLGYPNPRDVVANRNGQNGVDDSTEFFGARAVTLALVVQPTSTLTIPEIIDSLSAFMVPSRRPYLRYVLADGMTERQMRLRPSALGAPLEAPWWNRARRVQLGWVAPDGVQEAVDESSHVVTVSEDSEEGRTYDLTFDRVYPASGVVGAVTITNDGNLSTPPILRLYGPATDPRIENQTVDKSIVFDGLTLAASEYVEIDVQERTVYLNGDSTLNRYQYVDFGNTEWWELEPGDNEVRYYPVSSSTGAQAEIIWKPRWL